MKYFLFVVISLLSLKSFSQKRVVTHNDVESWPKVIGSKFNRNGSFISYSIFYGNGQSIVTLFEVARNKDICHFNNPMHNGFTSDGKYFLSFSSSDSLSIYDLAHRRISQTFSNAVSISSSIGDSSSYIIYKRSNENVIILSDLAKNTVDSIKNVKSYKLSQKGNILIANIEVSENTYKLLWIDIVKRKIDTIANIKLENYSIDNSEEQLIGIIPNQLSDKLYYYNHESNTTRIVNVNSCFSDSTYRLLRSDISFSTDGRSAFIMFDNTSANEFLNEDSNGPKVDVWNSKDSLIQSQQLELLKNPNFFRGTAILNLSKLQCVYTFDILRQNLPSNGLKSSYILICDFSRNVDDRQYSPIYNTGRKNLVLVNCEEGSERMIVSDRLLDSYSFSPHNKYVIYYDQEKRNYFLYDIKNNTTKTISNNINEPLYLASDFPPPYNSFGVAGWSVDEKYVFIYDEFDIWRVDIESGKATNFTCGVGRAHSLILRFAKIEKTANYRVPDTGTALLKVINKISKDEGFAILRLENPNSPELLYLNAEKLTISDYCRNRNLYCVLKMSSTLQPNLYLSRGLREFRPLTFLNNIDSVNWLKSELVKWESADNDSMSGILYKPGNFNAKLKYPVIFEVYSNFTDQIHDFNSLKTSNVTLNISWFTSNGYIVFRPDIKYVIGHPGESALKVVESAVRFLTKMQFIDSTKMGIQGASFGGYEVNYIITHSSLFAAASSACGLSNLTNAYNSLFEGGGASNWLFETNQIRIGATLWERPDLYLENSPIFYLQNVTTPLLITHNKEDNHVPWEQSVQLFLGLRRLGKEVWMLQYDGDGHGLTGDNGIDYENRLSQFFDHYLKGAPAPEWLTRGIPASSKGKFLGYDN